MFKKIKSMKWIVLFLSIAVSVMFFSGCPETLPPVAGSVSVTLSLSGNAGGEPYVKQVSFSADTSTVEVAVNSALSSVSVELAAELSGASLSVGGQALTSSSSISIDLPYGTTTVAVVVTPDNGDAVSYTLKITRPEPVYSDNADLTAMELSVGYLDPEFASSVILYETSVPDDTESITVTAALSDSAASMSVNDSAAISGDESGPIALVTGSNIISVKVTAEDGETVKTYTVDVERRAEADAVAPVLSLLGDDPMIIVFESDFTDPGATATDNVDGTWTVYFEDEVDTSTPGDYTLTYEAVDLDGNAAESITRTVTVSEPPPIEIPEAYYFWDNGTGYLHQSNSGDDSYAVVTNSGSTVDSGTMVEYDNDANYGIALSGEEYFKVEWTEPVDGVFEQSWTAGYSTVDAARAATADERTTTAYISADLVPPVIYLNGEASMSVETGGDFSDPGATVRDWGGNDDYTITAPSDNGFAIDTPDTYTFLYSETDTDGNSAVGVTRTVEVVAVETCEISTLYLYEPDYNQDWILFEIAGTDFTVTNAPGGDPVDYGEIIEFDNSTNVLIIYQSDSRGYSKITWIEPDADGHTMMTQFLGYQTLDDARAASQNGTDLDGYTIEVNVPPVIILNGEDTVAVELYGTFTDEGAIVRDWDDEEPDLEGDTSGLDTSTNGTYTVTYSHTDSDGNTATAEVTVVVGSGFAEIVIQ